MGDTPQDGLIAVVKRDCPTCELTASVLGELARRGGLQVYTQDDPDFPEAVPGRIDDTGLDVSHRLKIEVVPTLIRMQQGREVDRTYRWHRRAGTGAAGVTAGLRREECRAGDHRAVENPLQRDRAQIASHRDRRRRGRPGGDVRARLVGWAAARS